MRITAFKGEYAFLSNFHPSPITVAGIRFATVEHAFQAAKTHDPDEKRAVAAEETPGKAKRAGRKVKLRADWEEVKVEVMTDLVRRKFTEHEELKARLLATGHAELVEGNTWNDTFWGVCRGQGQNWLGRILMRVRTELAER